jgi:hypothetical protein
VVHSDNATEPWALLQAHSVPSELGSAGSEVGAEPGRGRIDRKLSHATADLCREPVGLRWRRRRRRRWWRRATYGNDCVMVVVARMV